jgi:hypothetical protein
LWVCVADRIQIVVSELKHHFVSQAVTKLLEEPVLFKHVAKG